MTESKETQSTKAQSMDDDVNSSTIMQDGDGSHSSSEKLSRDEMNNKFDKIEPQTIVGRFVSKLIPSVPHMVDLKDKLVEGEEIKDSARIRHYSEIQILIGFIAAILGFLLIFTNGFFLVLFFSGLYIMLTGYEIEDIAITSQRLILRRIGIWERIIKIPTEEEHLLNHIVSFNIGRAPFQIILVFLGLFGFIGSIALASIPFLSLIMVAVSLYLVMRGMRLGNRTVTVNFAGGHHSILGLRKGVPEHAVSSLKKAVFRIK